LAALERARVVACDASRTEVESEGDAPAVDVDSLLAAYCEVVESCVWWCIARIDEEGHL
jgi:hypothetical protein